MRWQGNRESDNVEDRRGESGGGGGGFGGLPFGGFHLGVGGIVLVLLGSWIFHVNPLTVLSLLSGGGAPQTAQVAPDQPAQAPPANDEMANFVRTVLASTEDVWTGMFQQMGKSYPAPKLVLYTSEYPTGCGDGQAAMGPFYCPQDHRVYIDLDFYNMLRTQLGSPGNAAQAYVIAHEVGHHVQTLLGLTDKVDSLRARESKAQANGTSVKVELRADCYAGVWANHSQEQKHWFENNDIPGILNAASHIGDDALEKSQRQRVMPENFTHGTSAQRVEWFKRGYANGRIEDCDTFGASNL